jgi:hypothetical protein
VLSAECGGCLHLLKESAAINVTAAAFLLPQIRRFSS